MIFSRNAGELCIIYKLLHYWKDSDSEICGFLSKHNILLIKRDIYFSLSFKNKAFEET